MALTRAGTIIIISVWLLRTYIYIITVSITISTMVTTTINENTPTRILFWDISSMNIVLHERKHTDFGRNTVGECVFSTNESSYMYIYIYLNFVPGGASIKMPRTSKGTVRDSEVPCTAFGVALQETSLGAGLTHVLFSAILGKWSNLTNIFQMGWSHQLVTKPWKKNFSCEYY